MHHIASIGEGDHRLLCPDAGHPHGGALRKSTATAGMEIRYMTPGQLDAQLRATSATGTP
jgi:hypothetical protein